MALANPLGLRGIDFVEFTSPDPDALHRLFLAFGFSRTMRHQHRAVDLYRQGSMTFLVNREPGSFAASFRGLHGPSLCSMGWGFEDPTSAHREACRRGASASPQGDHGYRGAALPAIYGIGESLLYFSPGEADPARFEAMGFVPLDQPDRSPGCGFSALDHLTNNVHRGTMERWARFYKEIFGFTEVRYFDIRGAKTGLVSYALRSPCGSFCIPINEGTEKTSQINEYLDQYRGPGVQHLAFLTDDILASLRALEGTPIEFLSIDEDYYDTIFQRVPGVTEDHGEIRRRNVLVDGDEQGYLLQIFTRNLIGPIFIELIQRKNHLSFGEGNFGALFRSIERDQERRGVLLPPHQAQVCPR